jgi:lysophospholipase L1-like esterase
MIHGMARTYVALGDSMSIDDYAGGAGHGAGSLLLRNIDADFAGFRHRDLATLGYSGCVLARDGAVAADVLNEQLIQMTEPATLATVTMGGNDLLRVYGDDAAATAVRARLAQTVEAVLTRLSAAGTRVVLTTIYDPSDGSGTTAGNAVPDWPAGPDHVAAVNAMLADLARRHDAGLADVHAAFRGHGAMVGDVGTSESRPADRDLWFCGVVEPNAWGADAIRRVWWEALDRRGWLDCGS